MASDIEYLSDYLVKSLAILPLNKSNHILYLSVYVFCSKS